MLEMKNTLNYVSKIIVQKWPKCDIEREVTLAAKDGYLTISVTIFFVSMLKC